MLYTTSKLSYQTNPLNRFSGFVNFTKKYSIDPRNPNNTWENRLDQTSWIRFIKTEWQAVRGKSVVFSLLYGYWRLNSRNPSITDNIGTRDIFTLVETGEPIHEGSSQHYGRHQGTATLNWYRPNWFYGNHAFKAGLDYYANFYFERRKSVSD